MNIYSKRQKCEITRAQLDSERTTFLPTWRDVGDYVYPRRPRFTLTDVNKGDRRNQKIVDSTATLAARTLRSGMMSGITSPARPWFRLTTPDPDMAEFGPVKDWLYQVTSRMQTSFLRSNLYNILPIVYGDMGTFATSAFIIEEDMDSVFRAYPFAIGSYMISNNALLKVDVFIREFRLTVRQCIQKFGIKDNQGKIVDWSNFSEYVKNAYDQNRLETWVDIVHIIQPNENYIPGHLHSKFKKFSSCYYERGTNTNNNNSIDLTSSDIFLSEKGYDYFPVLAPRWEVNGEDAYGTSCPGIDAIGDIKQLQLGEKRAMQAIEKMINPPMIGPTLLRSQKASILPGDITYSDDREGMKGFRPAHEINFRLNELDQRQQMCRERVKRCFFEDLFLMLSQDERSGITAREVNERHEEKLLALGPVLEQLNQDALDPLIDIAFDIHMKQQMLPPPPEELHGVDLRVEYISIMAQAQKLLGVASIDRFLGIAAQVAQLHPESLDKIDLDHTLDVYGDMASVPPKIVRTDDQVQQIRDQRAKQQQQQQQQQQIQGAAQTAQTLSQTDTGGDNALTRLLDQGKAGAIAPEK
jgi:hypothetical protein